MKKMDTFLEDELRPKDKLQFGYSDGFRFGFGMFMAWLVGILVVGAVTYGLSFIIHPH